jgi:hypothetical protein
MPAVNRHQQLLDLEELAAKLLEAARELPPGEIRHGTLKEIGRVRARLTLLQSVIMKECLPPLGRRSPSPRHILCNGGLSDIDAELEKLAMNPRCAPQWVGETDLANELTDFQRGLWTATARS